MCLTVNGELASGTSHIQEQKKEEDSLEIEQPEQLIIVSK